MATKPTILFVPGLWEGPTVFDQVCTLLQSAGYETNVASHPSTGTLSPGNPTMKDDILAIHAIINSIIQDGKEVLLVLHSAGGFLGSEAMKGLSVKERQEAGLKGGVTGIVFITAGLAPLGYQHVDLPFMDKQNAPKGGMLCVNQRETLFNDLSAEEAEKWIPVMKTQPAEGWFGVTEHCGWENVESTYLICEKDVAIPAAFQLQLATMVGSKIERCGAGHMVMLSMPERVVAVVRDFVEG